MNITNIVSLLSGVALFLFGMALMGDGLKKVAGSRLEVILYQLTGNPFKGFLLGTGVTAVIQSSSATSVMVVGFVNSGMMKFRQAIPIILGAILGTSITGWIIALPELGAASGWADLLSTAMLTGVISIVGILLRMIGKTQQKKHIGDILMGFAVLMLGMSTMSSAVSPLRQSEAFLHIMTSFSNPLLGILFGAAFTCLLQSASAAVGILQALAATGVVDFSVALPIIMGIAIGAAMPVILSAIGASTDGMRTALVYLVVQILGVAFCSLVFYGTNAIFHYGFVGTVMTTVSVALVNTVFRLFVVLILLPFVDLIEQFVRLLVKDKPASGEELEMMRLEERFIEHPALAIEQSRLTINAMAGEAQENFLAAMRLMDKYTPEGFQIVKDMENAVDRYEDRLGSYLVKLTGRELTETQNENVSKYLHTISDFERISDHALNLAETAQEIFEKGLHFSESGQSEIQVLQTTVSKILEITVTAFRNNDLSLAGHVEPLEEVVDDLCDEIKLHHIERLQKGQCTLMLGYVFNDLLTNFERVADHCSNVAVAMIELESDSFETHQYLSSLKDVKSPAFEELYHKYREEYHL